MLSKSFVLGSITVLLSLTVNAIASGVQILTLENFDNVVGSKPSLIDFYAGWCPHSKHLSPIYDKIADAFTEQEDKVMIAKIDADEFRTLGHRFGIKGYPTIKWFPHGIDGPVEPYNGKRDFESIRSFVQEKIASFNAEAVHSNVQVLTDNNIEEKIHKSGKAYFVEFYAPWCPHCQDLVPTIEKVGRDFRNDNKVVIAKIDATTERVSAKKYKIEGYPTILFFDTDGSVHEYDDDRTERSMLAFVNKRAGTNRVVGGRLKHKASRNAHKNDEKNDLRD
ncbi:hypothetical protein BGZ76_004581 [Entomortierella beljakovae]|nr:hypothetical protein BGZ76_004581 [Entomortierella beljakovae]